MIESLYMELRGRKGSPINAKPYELSQKNLPLTLDKPL
jgi:hypothetical protein